MSTLIKGMEMPTSCYYCPFMCGSWGYSPPHKARCIITGKDMPIDERGVQHNQACPLVPIPPHGRLIDADALYRTIDATSEKTIGHTTFKETVLLDIRGMPTILESTIGQVFSDEAVNEAEEGE